MSPGLVLILFLLLVSPLSVKGVLHVNIEPSNGACNITAQKMTCSSIEQFAREYANTSNVTIHVTGQVNIAALVIFRSVTNLSVIGNLSKPKARLVCHLTTTTPSCLQGNCTGLQFVKVKTLKIANVEIVGCGGEHLFRKTALRSAVYINRCRDVTLHNVVIMSSHHTSLFIENTSGNVSLEEVHVQDNILGEYTTNPKESFAGGVQILFQQFTSESRYKIINSQFSNIITPNYTEYNPSIEGDPTDWIGYGQGGGLSITLIDSTQQNVLVSNCMFENIIAPWGAGLKIKFSKFCSLNKVTIVNSTFHNCTACVAGGGLEIDFSQYSYNSSLSSNNINNNVSVSSSIFRNNRAKFGAGTYVVAFFGAVRNEHLTFLNCSWEENRAFYSPAVDISPSSLDNLRINTGSLPVPVFKDCNFIRNKIDSYLKNHTTWVTAGVFVITRFQVKFEGTFLFDSNDYSAMLVNSGQIVVEPNSTMIFTNNKGLRGGAIHLCSFSSILVSDNCTLKFFNNTATEYGGAIYQHSMETRELFAGRSCFLEYNGKSGKKERNIHFVFAGNTAPISGSSIYASSFRPCFNSKSSKLSEQSAANFLDEIGEFTLDPMNRTCENIAGALGTSGVEFINENECSTLRLFPGMKFSLPLLIQDELKQDYQTEFFTEIVRGNIQTDLYTVNKSIKVYGSPHDSAELVATTQNAFPILQYSMVVELLPCPPGYYFSTSDSRPSCRCSSTVNEQAFLGITKCNPDNFTAVIESGYWAGYYKDSGDLYIAVCPYEFCNVHTEFRQAYSLPNTSSSANLSSFICSPGREGVVCGECVEGYSVHYHSRRFNCREDDKCSYGIVFYMISELIPVFVFFTLVIIFDISFTSGASNGLVFFSQMVIILPLGFYRYDLKPAVYLQTGYNLFYRIFSIDFFSSEALSFCLFRGATVMDVLAFQYITILFAFMLVIAVVLCIKHCTCCNKLCTDLKKKMTATTSVLHGLSAFTVICYAKCIQTSFFILRQTTLQGAGLKEGPSVTFYGGMDYLQGKHIPYAILAIVSLGTIAVIPPILLLVYPSTLKVLELCRLNEHRLVTAILRVTRISTLMPMFDVFQGCFKNNFRFFSGLYFFYRMAILIPFAFSDSQFQYAIIAELLLLVMLGTHSIAQPYKLKAHNIIDGLLLLDLAIINGLKVAMLKISPMGIYLLPYIIYTQLLLIYIPIVVLAILSVVKLVKSANKHFSNKIEDRSKQEFLEHLDDIDRLADDSIEMHGRHFHSDYKQCGTP